MSENKKSFRTKVKKWADDHPQTVIFGTYIAALTGVITISMFNTNKQRITVNKQVLASEKLHFDNNKLLADRQDKANVFVADAAAAGLVLHNIDHGGILAIPGNTPQKIHYV